MQITFDVPDNTLMINLEYTYRKESGSLHTSTAHIFAEDIMSGKMLKAAPRRKNVEQVNYPDPFTGRGN